MTVNDSISTKELNLGDNAINDGLEWLGVKRDDLSMDHFDNVGLGSYRSNNDIVNDLVD